MTPAHCHCEFPILAMAGLEVAVLRLPVGVDSPAMPGHNHRTVDDELKAEYDLAKLIKEGVRGKYASRYREGTNLVLLAPDVAAVFPDEEAVNDALRLAIRLARIPRVEEQTVAET